MSHENKTPQEQQMPDVQVGALRVYSTEAARELGLLMPDLDPAFSGDPIPRNRLERMINSDSHEQIVAYDLRPETPRIIGALTMSEILEPGMDPYGYLGGVIVSPNARGLGVGPKMLAAGEAWSREKDMTHIEFVTESHRKAAIKMYEKWGAKRVTDGSGVKNGILYVKNLRSTDTEA